MAARLVRPDHHIEHIFRRAETALRIEGDVSITDAHATAVGGDILRLQLVIDLLFLKTCANLRIRTYPHLVDGL